MGTGELAGIDRERAGARIGEKMGDQAPATGLPLRQQVYREGKRTTRNEERMKTMKLTEHQAGKLVQMTEYVDKVNVKIIM